MTLATFTSYAFICDTSLIITDEPR